MVSWKGSRFWGPQPRPGLQVTHSSRRHTTDGLYSLICLSAMLPRVMESKCSTFCSPSASWSSGCFCMMLTNSCAHLAGAVSREIQWG